MTDPPASIAAQRVRELSDRGPRLNHRRGAMRTDRQPIGEFKVAEGNSRKSRRELIREYKQTPRPMGVYAIRNASSGRTLVGSSTDLPSILNRHRAQLRIGAHPNRDLQQDWNALGADAFAFEIIDRLEPRDEPGYEPADDLRALEQLWLERLDLSPSDRY